MRNGLLKRNFIKMKIDRRLFRHMSVRLAKKYIGERAKKLNYAINLKVGDLISSCKSYNERIAEIEPVWIRINHGSYIFDFDIVTETGNCCSVVHCCTFPLWTRDDIYELWQYWLSTNGDDHWGFRKYAEKIESIRASGGHAFDESGQPYHGIL
jgi:hypothetical protein